MNASTAGAARRLPLSYLPAAYLESSPKLAGSLTAGGVYLFGPDVWPGAWAWLALGPLIAVLVIEPMWRWTFTRVQLTPTHLNFTTGGIHRREQSLAWTDIAAVDSRQSWAFARWRLFSITLSQAGDERAKVQLWAADEDLLRAVTASAGHALDRAEEAPTEETEPTGTLLYRVRLGQLLLASVVFGQFAVIGGAAAMAVSEMLQTIGADDLIARWFPLPPAVWGASILGGVVALGLVLTVIRYASFEVRRMHDGRLLISYGLLSTHTRSVSPSATIGVVVQHNIVETLLGRVRLSLLTTDSAGQLGTNLVLPSLPRRVVEQLLREAFHEGRTTRLVTAERGAPALGTSVLVLAAVGVATALAGWGAAQAGWAPIPVIAVSAAAFGAAWGLSRLLCSGLSVARASDAVVLHVRHVLHRRTVLDAAAVHIVSTTRLGRRPLLAHVCYYAGMPRTFRAPRFTMDDIDTLSARLAQTVPLATTRRRALVPASPESARRG